MKILIQKVRENAIIPYKAHKTDAGYDCFISEFAKILYSESTFGGFVEKDLKSLPHTMLRLEPHERIACKLGFKTAIKEGYYCKIVPRSGNALWKGLTIVNSPGTIDSTYRGEWVAIVLNTSEVSQYISRKDKICQFIQRKLIDTELEVVEELEESIRGEGGFGSTDD